MGERFLALRQWGSVKDYRLSFETLASLLEGMPKTLLEGQFLNGLKPDIQAEMRVLRPNGQWQMMDVAQRIKERNLVVQGSPSSTNQNRGPIHSGHSGPSPNHPRVVITPPPPASLRSPTGQCGCLIPVANCR